MFYALKMQKKRKKWFFWNCLFLKILFYCWVVFEPNVGLYFVNSGKSFAFLPVRPPPAPWPWSRSPATTAPSPPSRRRGGGGWPPGRRRGQREGKRSGRKPDLQNSFKTKKLLEIGKTCSTNCVGIYEIEHCPNFPFSNDITNYAQKNIFPIFLANHFACVFFRPT